MNEMNVLIYNINVTTYLKLSFGGINLFPWNIADLIFMHQKGKVTFLAYRLLEYVYIRNTALAHRCRLDH